MDTVISGILAKNFVPDYSSETASAIRFLSNDNTWKTIQSASTTQPGIVTLSSSLTSSSEATAATSAAAKTLKDAIDTLNGLVTVEGSVLKKIKDTAKDATYSTTESGDVITIADAIEAAEATAEAASVVDVVKQTTAESGYSATYYITQAGVQVGEKINIPKDYLVKSAEVKTCTKDDEPVEGYKVGDKYIDFVINTSEGSGTESHIYLLVNDLVDVYTGKTVSNGVSISIDEHNEISATVSGKAIARTNITDDFESDIASLETKVGDKTVSKRIEDEAYNATYKAAEGSTPKVTIKGALDDIYEQIGTGGTVDEKITAAIAELDSTVTQTAGAANGNVSASVVEADGKLTSVSVSITPNTYDAYGAADTAESNANSYTDTAVSNLENGAVKDNADAIDAINDTTTGILAQANSYTDTTIAGLDSTVTNGVEPGDMQPDVVVSVTEADGKLTAVTATVTANRFDDYGAASAVQGETSETVASVKQAVDDLATDIAEDYVSKSQLGVASTSTVTGVATLDTTGKVPSTQLPSYVDDVVEGYYDATTGKFYKDADKTVEIPGESGKIYVDLTTNKTYRWSGTQFTVISETLALGETATTAYYGDKGKTAYEHSQSAHARVDATKTAESSNNGYVKINDVDTLVYSHPQATGFTSTNPHGTTASDVGLGNVDNKSSETIRSEITKTNVTTALGYEPATQDLATSSADGLMSSDDFNKLSGCLEAAVSADAPTFTSTGIWYQVISVDTE